MQEKVNIAIFASGAGTNARAVIQHFKTSGIAVVQLIITNKADAGVVRVAKDENIPFLHIPNTDLEEPGLLNRIMHKDEIDFIVLAGFLRKIPGDLIENYKGRMINIHPALLPKFGGKGMYGRKVHEEVLRTKEKETGITIHYVTEGYDEGDIIFQSAVTVSENDSVEMIEKKIHELEHSHYPVVIEELVLTLGKKEKLTHK